MGLSYPNQITFAVIGSRLAASPFTRTSVALTSAYNADVTKSFAVGDYSKMNLDVLYTMGATESTNSIELKVEGSPDGTNWYRLPNESVSSGTSTLTAREFTFVGTNADAATISIGIDIFYKFIKVSAKETGVASNAGTVYVEATLSGR
jgi:hypothetical protein